MQKTIRLHLLVLTTFACMLAPPFATAGNTRVDGLPDAPSASRDASADPNAGSHPHQSLCGSSDTNDHLTFALLAKRGLQDQCRLYTAPFHRSAIKWDVGVLAVTAALIAADRHITGTLSRKDLDDARNASNVALVGTLGTAGGIWLVGAATDHPHARETGFLTAEALANSAAVYAVLNVITGRQRPFEGDGKGRFFRNNTVNSSFPSGHAIVAWTAASVMAKEYPRPWLEILTYGAAAAVTATRFTSLQHFPSDVVVGGTLGYLIGREIFHAHCKPGLSSSCHAR